MLHGEERGQVDLSFSIPSVCAARVESGSIDVGLVPVAEIARQDLQIVSEVGIAAVGAVRSILLISQVPLSRIRTLAVDLSSRTSVQLAKVILRERFGVEPQLIPEEPNLQQMLAESDAALVIGDPALRIEPARLTFDCLDLGAEWQSLTGLPMVFAAWAGKRDFAEHGFRELAHESCCFGLKHLPEIVESEFRFRGISKSLAAEYFTRYIKFRLGPDEMRGLEAFVELAGLAPARSVRS